MTAQSFPQCHRRGNGSTCAPSAEEWRAAFEKARDILESIDYGSALIESELTHR